jgi:argininosuccinate synthase
MSKFLEPSVNCRTRMGTEKAYSTDANVLGATHEAKDARAPRQLMTIVNPIMGVALLEARTSRSTHETVTVTYEAGVPVEDQRQALRDHLRALPRGQRIGGRHGLGMSDQIENRVIDAKSRGIYEAPGMALLARLPTSACSVAIHNENTTDLYYSLGRRLGRLLYEGKWFDPEAMMLKDALTLGRARGDAGGHARAASRRRLHDPEDQGAVHGLRARQALDGEGRGDVHAGGPHRRARAAEPQS